MISSMTRICRFQLSRRLERPIPQPTLVSMGSYCPTGTMFSDISASITERPSYGVHILCAPVGAGKTTTTLRALQSLQDSRKISGAIHISWRHVIDSGLIDKPLKALKSAMEIHPNEPSLGLNPLFPKPLHCTHCPAVIFIEQFDHSLLTDNLKSFLVSLAEESVFEKRYTVIICTSSPAKALTLHGLNGKTKFGLITHEPVRYQWPNVSIKHLVAQLGDLKHLDANTRSRLLEAFYMVGTPGFVLDNYYSDPSSVDLIVRDAESKKNDWVQLQGAAS